MPSAISQRKTATTFDEPDVTFNRLRGVAQEYLAQQQPSTRQAQCSYRALVNTVLESLHQDVSRNYSLRIPAGVSDIDVMKAFNRFYRSSQCRSSQGDAPRPFASWDLIYPGDLNWFETVGGASSTPSKRPRWIHLCPRMSLEYIKGPASPEAIRQYFASRDYTPAKLSDVAIVAAAASLHLGEDVFKRSRILGAPEGSALEVVPDLGIVVHTEFFDLDPATVSVAGALRRAR